MRLFDVIELPFCHIVRIGEWNAPAHRYFLSYRAQGSFRHLMGLSVTDEFATFSTPIFLAPKDLLGKIYNAGLTLGFQRSDSLDIDYGWPPVCVGLDTPAPALPSEWETQLLTAVKTAGGTSAFHTQIDAFHVQHARIGSVDLLATSAPLLPKQLQRLCQISPLPCSLAFSTGNRIERSENTDFSIISAVSEQILMKMIAQITLLVSKS